MWWPYDRPLPRLVGRDARTDFELVRHFLRRFFDNEMVAIPREWQKVAIGIFATLVSLGLSCASASIGRATACWPRRFVRTSIGRCALTISSASSRSAWR